MQQAQRTPQSPLALLFKICLSAGIALMAMKIHAAVTINFSSQFATNQKADGSPMDSSFTFQLGAFDTTGGWAPTTGNTDEWLARWTPVTDSGGTALPGATVTYGPITTLFGPTEGFNSSVVLDHNNTPFETNQQGYLFGYDSQSGNSEWILMTNYDTDGAGPDTGWLYPSGTAGIPPAETWTPGSADVAIIGDINFNDGATFVQMRAGSVTLGPVVPEPSSAALAGGALALLALRRRRPRRP